MQERAADERGGDIGRNRSDADVDSTSNLSREMVTQMVAGDEIDRSQLLVCPMRLVWWGKVRCCVIFIPLPLLQFQPKLNEAQSKIPSWKKKNHKCNWSSERARNNLVVHLTGWTLLCSTQESAVPGV